MIERKASVEIASPRSLDSAVFKIEKRGQRSCQAPQLFFAIIALLFFVCLPGVGFAQSATGRPEKARPPVKTPGPKRATPSNKTPTQNPEDTRTQQPTDTKPATQTNEVKPGLQTVDPKLTDPKTNPKIPEQKLSVPLPLLKQALNCVGLIMVRNKADEMAVPRGSGVLISPDGIIATNYHVVHEDNQDRLFDEIIFSLPEVGMPATAVSAKRFMVQVVQKSKDNDLVLLRVTADQTGKAIDKSVTFQAVELGDSSKVELMDNLVIVGFPATGGLTVTTNAGVVQGKDLIENWIKTDARLLHGNSGGAAIDDKGKLIGIPTKVEVDRPLVKRTPNIYSKEIEQVYAIGYLRPSNLIAKMLETLRYRESKPPTMASGNGDNTANEAPQFINIKGIIKSSADGTLIAGARVGLVSVDSEEITAQSLLSWGSSNAEGRFELNRPVAVGKYKLRVKALGFELYTREIQISPKQEPIVIELKKTS